MSLLVSNGLMEYATSEYVAFSDEHLELFEADLEYYLERERENILLKKSSSLIHMPPGL